MTINTTNTQSQQQKQQVYAMISSCLPLLISVLAGEVNVRANWLCQGTQYLFQLLLLSKQLYAFECGPKDQNTLIEQSMLNLSQILIF